MENKKFNPKEIEEIIIDYKTLIAIALKEKKIIYRFLITGFVFSIIFIFSVPKEYNTSILLASELEIPKNNISGLAAMAGINVANTGNSDALSLDIYPNIIKSTPFLIELLNTAIEYNGDLIILYDYIIKYEKSTWWENLLILPLKVFEYIKSIIKDEHEKINTELIHLSKEEEKIHKKISNQITISIDKKTSIINISVNMQDPYVSAKTANIITSKLQDYIIVYRTEKAKQDLEFTQKIFSDAKYNYYKVQSQYAKFEDLNKNIATASFRIEQERLRNEMSLNFSIFNSLAQKLEQDKLRVQEQTPVFVIVEPAKIPLRASYPNKLLILIGSIFLSFTLSLLFLIYQKKTKIFIKNSISN